MAPWTRVHKNPWQPSICSDQELLCICNANAEYHIYSAVTKNRKLALQIPPTPPRACFHP